jgi:purine catabolism regulator
MTITIREALELSPLQESQVLTGEVGLDREICAVTVMDAPDVVNWLTGNEFVITSGYSVKDNPLSLETLVKDLAKINAAGLGIKLRRFIDEIPPSIIALSVSLELPIIVIPFEVPWVDIINAIHQEIMHRQSQLILQGEKIYRKFSMSLLEKGGFAEISQVLYDLIDSPVLIMDYQGNRYAQGWKKEVLLVKDRVEALMNTWDWLNGDYSPEVENSTVSWTKLEDTPYEICVCPIIVESEVNGYIVALALESARKDLYYEIAIEQAAVICALRTMITFNTKEVHRRFKNRYAQDLLAWNFRDVAYARKQAAYVGWVLRDSYSVLAVSIDNLGLHYVERGADEGYVQAALEQLYKTITQMDRTHNLGLILHEQSDHFLVLKPQDSNDSDERVKELTMEFARTLQTTVNSSLGDLSVSIGISRFNRDIKKLSEGQKQAISALKYGRMLEKGNGIWHYDDLGVFRILCEFDKEAELQGYYDDTIAKLEVYDQEHRAELVKTLIAYFDNDCSLQKAADELFIHYNTMRYRIERINEVTGLDVFNSNDRLNLQIGLKIGQLLN